MTYRHPGLAAGRWGRLTFLEQMAHIGSEVERALNWRIKNNETYAREAFERALELIDLTLESAGTFACRRELARLREAWVDYFFWDNQYQSTESSWKKYFLQFAFAARRNH